METSKIKMLVIEDNLADARQLGEALKERGEDGFEMTHESSLQGAMRRLTEEKVDLILLDLSLPGTSGLETLEKVRAASSKSPLIVWTGSYDPSLSLTAIKKGALFCFSKDTSSMSGLVKALQACSEFKKLEL